MLVYAVVLALVVSAGRVPEVRTWWTARDVSVTLALVSVAVGMLAASSCIVIGRLTDDARGLWMGGAITVYSVIAIPAATLEATGPFSDVVLGNIRLAAHIMFVALSFIAAFATARPPWDGWSVALGGLLLAGVVTVLGELYPSASDAVNTSTALRLCVSAFWVLSGLAMVFASWTRREEWISWVGMGCTVIAVAHVLRVLSSTPSAPLGVSFSIVRLFGVLLLALGTAVSMGRSLAGLQDSYCEYQDSLRLAKLDLEAVERRDHDVRNGLAGLAGVAAVLDVGAHDPHEVSVLRKALEAELTRLDRLLRQGAAGAARRTPSVYEIEPMLRELTALQTRAGMDVRADVERGLRAVGDSAVVAQVLINLLANCAQHAAGSPVRIQARQVRGRIEIRVRDFGPGLPPGAENDVLGMGVRGRDSTGQGLGLHICRRLLAEQDATIELRSGPQPGAGCTALVTLPRAPRNEGSAHRGRHTSVGGGAVTLDTVMRQGSVMQPARHPRDRSGEVTPKGG